MTLKFFSADTHTVTQQSSDNILRGGSFGGHSRDAVVTAPQRSWAIPQRDKSSYILRKCRLHLLASLGRGLRSVPCASAALRFQQQTREAKRQDGADKIGYGPAIVAAAGFYKLPRGPSGRGYAKLAPWRVCRRLNVTL